MERERNLLFGIFGVQLHQFPAECLIRAAAAWQDNVATDIPSHLVQTGYITEETRKLIEELVEGAIRECKGSAAAALDRFGGEHQVHVVFQGVLGARADHASTVPIKGIRDVPQDLHSIPSMEEAPGRYTYSSEYARGGVGRVLLVHDQHLGRDIALKELLPVSSPHESTLSPDERTGPQKDLDLMGRFLQEARITGQLEHPSIVPVYELGKRSDGTLYYTMKLVRGKTLAVAVREAKPLTARLGLLPHFVDLCQAVAYAHSKGVLHRDLKPGNVMVGEFGETVVLDWGLAKVRGHEDVHAADIAKTLEDYQLADIDTGDWTQKGQAMGTPAFMPPEQALGRLGEVDERSDVYSLGAVLYHLLTGVLPFTGDSSKEIMRKVVDETPRPVREVEPEIPPELAAICQRAMSPDPRKRYASPGEIADEIARFQSGALVRAYEYGLGELVRRFVGRHRAVLSTGAAALLLLVVIGVYSYVEVVRERAMAIAARNRERAQRVKAERLLYVANVRIAQNYIDNQRYDLALQALETAPATLRNWEWHYLDRLCRQDEFTLPKQPGSIFRVAFTKSGNEIVAVSDAGTCIVADAKDGSVFRTIDLQSNRLYTANLIPNTSRLVTASSDGASTIWNLEMGTMLTSMEQSPLGLMYSACNPNDDYAVAVYREGRAVTWRQNSGAVVSVFNIPNEGASRATFSPVDPILVFPCSDGTAHVYDYRSDRLVAVLEPRIDADFPSVERVAFNDDGSRLAVVTTEPAVVIYDSRTFAELSILAGHSDAIESVQFNAEGTRLLTASRDRSAKIWAVSDGACLITLTDHHLPVLQAVFSPDGQHVITGSEDKTAKLWDAATGRLKATLEGHSGLVNDVACSPDGRFLLTGSEDGMAKVWLLQELPRSPVAALPCDCDYIEDVTFSPKNAQFLTVSGGGPAFVWDAPTQQLVHRLDTDHTIYAAQWSADGTHIAVCSPSGHAGVWDAQSGRLAAFSGRHAGPVISVTLSPDGTRILTTSKDTTAALWDASTGQLQLVLAGHEDSVLEGAFSPDGKRVATVSGDGTARIWDAQTGAAVLTLRSPGGTLFHVAFTPDGRKLFASCRAIYLWDLATGQLERTLAESRDATITSFAVSPSSGLLIASDDLNRAGIWDYRLGAETIRLTGHSGPVWKAVFSPDGRRALTCSQDGTLRVWDADSGNELFQFMADEALNGTDFSPDGAFIVAGSSRGTIFILGGR